MSILLPALVFLLPLLILPGFLFHYDITPKVVLLSLAVAACCALPRQIAHGVAALWNKRSGRWFCLLAGAQTAWYGLASALSARPWFSLLGSSWRRMGFMTVIALCAVAVLTAAHLSKKPEVLSGILRAFVLAAIVVSGYGILQYFDIDPLQNAAGYHARAGESTIVRPPGTLGHADYFGWWLSIAFFCAIASARVEKRWWRRGAFAASVLCVIAIMLSGTRSAVLALAIGAIPLAASSRWKPQRGHALAGLAMIVLISAFYASPAGTRIRARVRWSVDEPIGGARPLLWRDSWRMAASRPIFGVGPETFSARFPRFQSPSLARLLPDFYYESPHNTALDALTSEGIPGVLLALCWVLAGLDAARSLAHTRNGMVVALSSALLASCAASMFTAVTAGPAFATILVVALLVALTPEQERPRPAVRTWVILAASAPLALCLAWFGVSLALADFRLAQFQAGSTDPARAAALCHAAERAAPPGAGEDLYSSRRLNSICGNNIACLATAMHEAVRATQTADNPANAWYNLAILAAQQGNAADVERALLNASQLAPDWFKPHWAMANLLALTGRAPEALRQARLAFQLDAGKDSDVTQTFLKLTNTPH